jgi:hypothetical protein
MKSSEQCATVYLAKLPPAVAGNGGHAATFAAACRLVEFGLTMEQAAPVLAAWNETHCDPRWTEAELRHKLADAFKRKSPKGDFTPLQSPCPTHKRGSNQILARRFSPALVENGKPAAAKEIDALAAKLHAGTEAEQGALAALRGLSVAAVALASARGLLRFGKFRGQQAWFILDRSRRVIQARRLDGQQWTANAKAWTLAGSQAAWPVGIGEAENFSAVALCEGSADLLAACHFIAEQGRAADWAPVAMLSASYKIPGDALPMFAGKRVRIFAHNDVTGYAAAARWTAQLKTQCGELDAFAFAGIRTHDGQPVKDLNDFAQAEATTENKQHQKNLLP